MATKKATEKQLKITLVKSPISSLKDQQATLESLGLRKLNSETVQPDNAATRGKVFKVKHLVRVEEV